MIRESKRRNELVHSSWFPLAQHVLCKRTTAVVRLEILTFPKTDINLSGNFSYMFQQLPLLFTIDYYAC